MRLPDPRGPLSEALFADLARRHPVRRDDRRAPTGRPRAAPRPDRRRPADQPGGLLRAALPGLRRRLRGLGVGPGADRAAGRARAAAPRRAARRWSAPLPTSDEPVDRQLAALIAADDGPSLSSLHGQAGHARAVARVPDAAVGLPPQGGRPAHLRHPPPVRADEGGDGRDPGRRVRRRQPAAHAQRAVRRPDARPRPRRRATAPSGTRPRPRPSPRSTRCRCSGCTAAGGAPRSATWPAWR